MTRRRLTTTLISIAAASLVVFGWLLHFHTAVFTNHLPKWGWLQSTLAAVGEASPAAEADEDPDNSKNEIPVHVAKVTVVTVHKYLEGFGTVAARPARGTNPTGTSGGAAGGASLVSPVAGVAAKVVAQVGQRVQEGDVLIQLDDRLAASMEESARGALTQAQASLKALLATPRPEQLAIADLAVQKSQTAADFAQKNFDRAQKLAAAEGIAAKAFQQVANDLATATSDLATAKQQLLILKNTPTPEDVAQENAKMAQATAALKSAQTQRQLLQITAPISATVAAVSVNPGEAVDTAKVVVQLVALDRLCIMALLPADQLPAQPTGLPAQILVGDADAGVIEAKVSAVSPQIDIRNGSILVTLDLAADTPLRPGQTVRTRLIVDEHKDALVVPRSAVATDENGDSVISVVEGDQATHKSVKLGFGENGLIEVIADGLKEGTTVVTAGSYGLPQATHIKIVP